MTIPGSELEIHETETPIEDDSVVSVAGRSPTQLAIARFRADKLSMISFVLTVFIIVCAIAAPILVALGVLAPNEQHQDLLSADGVVPEGATEGGPTVDRAAQQLGEWFAGEREHFDLPLAPVGTAFQRRVWAALVGGAALLALATEAGVPATLLGLIFALKLPGLTVTRMVDRKSTRLNSSHRT